VARCEHFYQERLSNARAWLTAAADQGRRSGAGRQIELKQNVGDVSLHRMIAKPQLFSDPGIAEPVGHESQHLAFPIAQYFQSGRSRRASVRLKVPLGRDGKEAQAAISVRDDLVVTLHKTQSRTRNKIPDDRRSQHLAGGSECGDLLGNVECAARDHIVQNRDFAGMHAYRQVSPTVMNAIHAATGKPVRSLPLKNVKLV
jgi:hypothetical protein